LDGLVRDWGLGNILLIQTYIVSESLQILPQSIRNAFTKANDPFTAVDVKRVFPDWTPDIGVKQKVIGGGLKGAWG